LGTAEASGAWKTGAKNAAAGAPDASPDAALESCCDADAAAFFAAAPVDLPLDLPDDLAAGLSAPSASGLAEAAGAESPDAWGFLSPDLRASRLDATDVSTGSPVALPAGLTADFADFADFAAGLAALLPAGLSLGAEASPPGATTGCGGPAGRAAARRRTGFACAAELPAGESDDGESFVVLSLIAEKSPT